MNIITNNRPIVIGIDHGFGNVKTSHTCFKTGVTAHDKEPTFKSDLLIYEGRYYTVQSRPNAALRYGRWELSYQEPRRVRSRPRHHQQRHMRHGEGL